MKLVAKSLVAFLSAALSSIAYLYHGQMNTIGLIEEARLILAQPKLRLDQSKNPSFLFYR